MPPTTICRRGDVVLVPFPFTDLSTTKQRPAVILSSERYHQVTGDCLVAAITSVRPPTRWDIACASFSCALKNSVGCVHGKNKPWAYGSAGWEPSVAELNVAVRPRLFVVDGLTSMVAGGPWSGEALRTNLILASGDPVALDIVALGFLKSVGRSDRVTAKGVWEQGQIQRAIALGLGARGPEEVRLVAENLNGDSEQFRQLVRNIRQHVGLGEREAAART